MRLEIHAKATGSRARVAMLATSHDSVETPVFMPVGTRTTVRTQTLEQLGAPILLANTYHLLVRPGRRDAHAADPDHPPGPRPRVERRKPQVQR